MCYACFTWIFINSFINYAIPIIVNTIKPGITIFWNYFSITIVVNSINHVFVNESITIIVSWFHSVEVCKIIDEIHGSWDSHPFSCMVITNNKVCFFIRIIVVCRFISHIIRYFNSINFIPLPCLASRNNIRQNIKFDYIWIIILKLK